MEKADAIRYCKKILPKVSRSFALTIPMLDDNIYKPIMVTYLQDRLLDNFEDEIKDISLKKRKFLMDKVVEIFDPDSNDSNKSLDIIISYADLLEEKSLQNLTRNADILKKAFSLLEYEVKKISYKWLKEMNQGMKKYLTSKVNTFEDLDEYCYYVAGTVGGFLTETIIYKEDLTPSAVKILMSKYKDAGLFLQKVNLVRDIKNDIKNRDKNYWPLQSLNTSVSELLARENEEKSLEILKRMLNNIKSHILSLLEYYQALPDSLPGYKKFFCVNNALGLATIKKMENNPDIFYGKKKVKVPKFQFLKIIKSPEKEFIKRCRDFLNTASPSA
ncbi:MAG: squalene/phytoene synthase family protein [Halanaerobiales bacterium]